MNKHTHTVVVTIGRNIKSKPMNAEHWQSFKTSVYASIVGVGHATILQYPALGKMRAHDQVGVWDGNHEGAATFVALISGYRNITLLRKALALDALDFKQEAIGCVVTLGTDHLVCP